MMELGHSLEDRERYDTATIVEAISSARRRVEELGGAELGDKTMIDAVVPFERSLIETTTMGAPISEAFDAACKANARNVSILRGELERPGSTRKSSTAVVLAVGVALVVILGAVGWLAFSVLRTVWQAVT